MYNHKFKAKKFENFLKMHFVLEEITMKSTQQNFNEQFQITQQQKEHLKLSFII